MQPGPILFQAGTAIPHKFQLSTAFTQSHNVSQSHNITLFVIMMFNLPLPGGTTGHAVGVGIAAVVLGPWAALLAVSMALLIRGIAP